MFVTSIRSSSLIRVAKFFCVQMSLESSRSDIVTQITTKCGTFDMCATSATNVAQNVAQFYLYFKYKTVYVHEKWMYFD